MERPIWLIGMMGSGKTTVAPLVAAALGRDWLDADTAIEDRTGRTIAELFDESEIRFRAAEVDAIRALAAADAVIATGGGAVMTEAAEIMSGSGVVVWLRTATKTLAGRVGDGSNRPLLTEGVAALALIERERREHYSSLADVVVDTDNLTPAEVADRVVEAWTNVTSQV